MDVLIKPVISEKMSAITEKLNSYGFIVDKRANKIQIKNAVEKMYGVTVETVNTMRYSGKIRMRGTKSGQIAGKTNAFKKAIVIIAKGETIDFYSNI